MKKILCLVLSLLCCFATSSITSVVALEQGLTKDQLLNLVFDGEVPKIEDISHEDLENYAVVFDSRIDSIDKAVLIPKSIPSNYDYYRTYNYGVTCKGEGAAASPQLNVNITFYINVFFRIDSNHKSLCIGYENPVITGVNNHYGATGYSNPKVIVTSWSSSQINFKGTCTLTAGMTFTMSGTSYITLPW